MRPLGIAAIVVAGVSLAAQQQQPPPTFRSGAQVVEVDVRVVKDGRFVTDLTAADFQISEDGAPQQIQSVTLISGTAAAPSAAAPAAGLPPATGGAAARAASIPPAVFLFVFDTTHLTPGPFQRAREATAKFIAEKFREGDVGGVVVDGKMANNRLTSDRAELKAAVEAAKMPGDLRSRQLDAREWPRLQDEFEAWRVVNNDQEAIRAAVARACNDDPDACRRAPPDMQVMEKARRVVEGARRATAQALTTINALCNGLTRLPGAKSVILFSEGFVVQDMESQLRQITGQAARAGAHFYTIDARGLNKGPSAQILDQPFSPSTITSGPTFDMQADGTNSLAIDTGGMAIRNENNFTRALDEIQQDAGTYYVVAYMPANAAFDGKYRSIDVKVSRPGVKVRARRGYLALPPAALTNAAPAAAPKRESEETSVKPDAAVSTLPLREDVAIAAPTGPGRSEAGTIVAALGRNSEAARLRPNANAGGEASAVNAAAERGWSAYERGDVETAARELGEAAKAPDARPWMVYALGLAQFALRLHKDAAQSWERVRRDAPDFEPIYFSLADAYALQHEDALALKVLRDAEARWPQDAEVANAIGVVHVRRGALDAAIDSFERATHVAPSDALGYFNLARTAQLRALKAQRYDRQMEKWIGGDDDRRKAIANFEKYLELGGPYERQAREALASLNWK